MDRKNPFTSSGENAGESFEDTFKHLARQQNFQTKDSTSTPAQRQSQTGFEPFASKTPLSSASNQRPFATPLNVTNTTNRSNSVSSDASTANLPHPTRQSQSRGGIGSFLSRATSVTSTSSSLITDKVNEAVGNVRNAVDSISSTISQGAGVGSSSNAAATAAAAVSAGVETMSALPATTTAQMPVISRQRLVLIFEDQSVINWPNQFAAMRAPSATGTQFPPFSSFFASTQSSSQPTTGLVHDLHIEQANLRHASVLANLVSSTASVSVEFGKIVRPEFAVIRQQLGSDEQLERVVEALDCCQIPMLEPLEVAQVFCRRQRIIAKLARIQRILGKDNFPLIAQVFCQTARELQSFVQSSNPCIDYPIVVRICPSGNVKLKLESSDALRQFAGVASVARLSCSLEPYVDNAKFDLLLQKIGNKIKVFRRNAQGLITTLQEQTYAQHSLAPQQTPTMRQPISKQTSLISSSVLSSLKTPLSSLTSMQQQPTASISSSSSRTSKYQLYEQVEEGYVADRYYAMTEAICAEFGGKLQVFSLKLIVDKNDKEHIIGLKNCAGPFVGSQENQDEDRRAFANLLVAQVNMVLPRTLSIGSRQVSELSPTISSVRPQPRGASIRSHSVSAQSQLDGSTKSDTATTAPKTPQQQLLRRSSESLSSDGSFDATSSSAFIQSVIANKQSSGGEPTPSSAAADDGSTQFAAGRKHQRHASLGQSLIDSTQSAAATALTSFQNRSLSFLRRFERDNSDNPSSYDQSPAEPPSTPTSAGIASFKPARSVDSANRRKEPPAKPPPPASFAHRQSSLVGTSSFGDGPSGSSQSPNWRQNTISGNTGESSLNQQTTADSTSTSSKRQLPVVRQNSALSAFEQFDGKTADDSFDQSGGTATTDQLSTKTTTSEQNAEDTMNQLRKNFASFASIFGDD